METLDLTEQGTDLFTEYEDQLDEPWVCEGIHHSRGISGHDKNWTGDHYDVISPCCGPKVIQCEPRVLAMKAGGVLYCSLCDKEHLTSQYDFIKLPPKRSRDVN